MKRMSAPGTFRICSLLGGAGILVVLMSSCMLLEITGDTIVVAGKTAVAAVKTTEAVVGATAKAGKAGARLVAGKRVIKLERDGNSFYVDVRINRRYKTRLLLDTGATHVQISSALARRMRLERAGDVVPCTLADGSVVYAREVNLRDVRIGRARAKNVRALVFEYDKNSGAEGLLGMSFLEQFLFEIDTDRNLLILTPNQK